MRNTTNKVIGIILVVLGALFLLQNLNIIGSFSNIFNIGTYWPAIFLIVPGLLFHLGFFSGSRRNPGLLVPGGILLILGIAFQINMIFGGWSLLWPLYIFSVAFGLFELYIFGNRDRGLLIPVGILGGLSIIFFLTYSINELFGYNTRGFITPLILIVIGLVVIFSGRKNK